MKKVITFDLDDTLAESKSPISDEMSELLVQLLDRFEVCVISGGKQEQFEKQVVARLPLEPKQLSRLHLMPTCGTKYLTYDLDKNDWITVYSEDLKPEEKQNIIAITEREAKAYDLWPSKPYGEVIEDRGSQISISMLGQEAPASEKYAWAEKFSERRAELRDKLAEELLDFEVRTGGTTTIDITRLGIDKAYGMEKLMQQLNIDKKDILFIGDKLEEGGNDYPVKAMGIDSLEVSSANDTARVLQGVLHALN